MTSNTPTPSEELISGIVERITFHNALNGYTVAKIQQPRKKELTTIIGIMPGVKPGQTLYCEGSWKHVPSHGWQFNVSKTKTELPTHALAMCKYLESGFIKGIGPVYAKRIVDHFGDKTFEFLDHNPEQLKEVSGLGPKRIETIIKSWQSQQSIRKVMLDMQSFDISPGYAQRIWKTWGENALEKIKEDPYSLARDIHGIGFKIADKIAQKIGLEPENPSRICAAIEHFLFELSQDGHTCYPKNELIKLSANNLELDAQLVSNQLDFLLSKDRLKCETRTVNGENVDYIWSSLFYSSEYGISRQLARILHQPSTIRPFNIEKALDWGEEKFSITLAPQQRQAIIESFKYNLHIVTGGPGTGKSTLTKLIVLISQQLKLKIVLGAPTGKAAKRLSEVTNLHATTIHQLLEFDFATMKFKRGKENPLEGDLFIIDEVSMIDTLLFYNLVKAIPDKSKLILLGDIDQLPSVGAGCVLTDLISSKCIPTTTLTEIFRQASESKIITTAHAINKGIMPDFVQNKDDDFFFIETEDPEKIVRTVVSLVCQRLPAKKQLNPFWDIQVLTPMRKGIIGIDAFNQILQKQLLPNAEGIFWGPRHFVIGDKVMQIRNDYRKEVFNGDIGQVEDIDRDGQQLFVKFLDGKIVEYEFSELDDLVHAYAVSIHKYQGSECPCIIIPLHTTHAIMLKRNLLYTAVTRGKKLVIVVGSRKAFMLSVRTLDTDKRHTGLREILIGKWGKKGQTPF